MNRLLLVLLGICLVSMVSYAKKENDGQADLIEDVIEEGADDDDDDVENNDVQGANDRQIPAAQQNPCNKKKCNRGEECIIEGDEAKCICQRQCPSELDPRYKVCTTKNVTFESECHLDREKCLCRKKSKECTTRGKKPKLDYYGECIELQKCPKDEFEQFPQRMRDWLYRVMGFMAKNHEIDEYMEMFDKARHEEDHADAVIWKFCDLDTHPHDRFVTKRELQFVVASYKAMEKCLVPFLNKCDSNKDRKITLIEWGTCLQIENSSIEDKCKDLQKNRKSQ